LKWRAIANALACDVVDDDVAALSDADSVDHAVDGGRQVTAVAPITAFERTWVFLLGGLSAISIQKRGEWSREVAR
jgi:hypothetical protein